MISAAQPAAAHLALTFAELRRNPPLAPGGADFPAVLRTFLPLVHGAAEKLAPEDSTAPERITQAVFECLAAHWKQPRKRASLAAWLLHATRAVAGRERKRLRRGKPPTGGYDFILKHLLRLPPRMRDALVLREILGPAALAEVPNPARMEKLAHRGTAKLQRKLGKSAPEWRSILRQSVTPVPPAVTERILAHFEPGTARAQRSDLTRATLTHWRWLAAGGFLKRIAKGLAVSVCVLLVLGFTFNYLARKGYLTTFFFRRHVQNLAKEMPEIAQPARPWPVTASDLAHARTEPPRTPAELYTMTNIWPVRLSFTREAWKNIQPARVEPVENMFQNGRLILRNPKAQRSGLSGVIGMDFNWVPAQMQFAGLNYGTVGARYRGNGTFLMSLYGPKQPFKVDLNKFTKKQALAGLDELNFANSIPDFSYVRDALAEQLFRDLGVPAPRTAYAYLSLDVPGKWTNQAMGLYVMVENIDEDFAEDRFGVKKTPIFKPVTYELFADLGPDWSAYDAIYDLKTKATAEQLQRVIDLSQLVTHGSDDEFAARIADFVDLEEFAAFFAGHVLLSSYDGFLHNGQNFYIYLHPRSNKFGFISWDQDHSWGEFGHVGTAEQREHAKIWEPWIYDFRFLKRMMKVETFREIYRRKLEHALEHLFTVERLYAQVDQLAAAIRPAVAAESDFRLKRFDQSVSSEWLPGPRDGEPEGPKAPVQQIKRFIANRIVSVRNQLDGKSEGMSLERKY